MVSGMTVRLAAREFDRDQAALVAAWERIKPQDNSHWDCAGDDCIYDSDGWHVCEYVKVGSEGLTYWEEMVLAWA